MRIALVFRGEHSRCAVEAARGQPARQATSILDIWPNIQQAVIEPLQQADNICDVYFVTYESEIVAEVRETCNPQRIDIHPKVSQIENFAFVIDLMERMQDGYDRFIVARCDIKYRLRIYDWPNWHQHGILLVGRDRCWPSKRLYDDHLFVIDSDYIDVFRQAFKFRQWPEEDLHGIGRYLYLHYHLFYLMYDGYHSCFNSPPHPLLIQAGIEPNMPDLDSPVEGQVMAIDAFNDSLCYCSRTPCICRVADRYHSITRLLEFDFHPGLDSMNGDLKFAGRLPIDALKLESARDITCIGFNALGFLKNKIGDLTSSPYYTTGDGFYINRIRYQQQQMLEQNPNAALNCQLLSNQSLKALYLLAVECNSVLNINLDGDITLLLFRALLDGSDNQPSYYRIDDLQSSLLDIANKLPLRVQSYNNERVDLSCLRLGPDKNQPVQQIPRLLAATNRYLLIETSYNDYESGEWGIIASILSKNPEWQFRSSYRLPGDNTKLCVLERNPARLGRVTRHLWRRKVMVGTFASQGPPHDDGLPLGDLLDKYCQTLETGGADVVVGYTPETIRQAGEEWAVHHYRDLPMRYNIGYHTTGLGAWRAFILRDLFSKASDGDVVVLQDPNYQKYPGFLDVAQNIRTFALRCTNISIPTGGLYMPMHAPQYRVGTYTRSCLFDILDVDRSVASLPIGRMRCTIMTVSSATKALVDDFYQTCYRHRAFILADNCQCGHQHPLAVEGINFSHNTADQAVFNLLAYRHRLFGTRGNQWNFRYRGHGELNDRKYLTDVLDFDDSPYESPA